MKRAVPLGVKSLWTRSLIAAAINARQVTMRTREMAAGNPVPPTIPVVASYPQPVR